jgi:hypothetical protein
MRPITAAPLASAQRRPVGVWLLTIANALVAGLIPLLGDSVRYFSGPGLPGGLLMLLVAGALSLAIIVTSLRAWARDDRARQLMLVLILLFHGLTILSSLLLLGSTGSTSLQSQALAEAVRSLFWIGINLWYFLRRSTLAWYRG